MITIIYSTHKDEKYNQEFKSNIFRNIGIKDVQILEYVNKNEYSLSQIYNRGIEESIYNIVVCIHNDVKIEKGWGKKLLDDFHNNPEFAIIGKAGSCYMPESGIYWERMNQTMVGQVYHEPDGHKRWLSKYSPNFPNIIPVVTIDGLFISFDKTRIKHVFDENMGGFHFYDHGFCIPNFLDGVKIGVTSSFEIIHKSVGKPNDEFYINKDNFVEKYKNQLPIELKPEFPYFENINEKPIKNIGKVAVIIPNKSNNELLFDCINSFYNHCNYKLFHIFVADTGSNEEEIQGITDFISSHNNITLVKYDYYNYAKINNDIVRNYIDDNFEFLLFCNNDIKLINNVIYGMLKIFKSNPKIGTVGARLHFGDNTVQHDGVVIFFDKFKNLKVTHKSFKNGYNHSITQQNTIGNTAALMMIKKKTFTQCGFFNENYQTCFEDVELNLTCLIKGYVNICDSSLVAYHLESQTRSKNISKMENEKEDFYNILLPFIEKNMKKLKNYIPELK